MDYKKEYWLEAFNCALEEVDAFELLTDEQKDKIAESLVTSAECQSMAFGYDAIPNPANHENDRIKSNYEKRINELEKEVLAYRNSVAIRRNVDVSRVYLDGKDVMISAR